MSGSSKGKANPHKGWNLNEKKALWNALKTHGHYNINAICQAVPTKTKLSIKKYLDYYQSKANKDVFKFLGTADKRKPECERNSPITQWIGAFTQCSDKLFTMLPCALKLIAHLENHPDPEECDGIDLKALYLFLASSLEGNTLDLKSAATKAALNNTLISLSIQSKHTRRIEDVDFVMNITRLFADSAKVPSTNDQDDNGDLPQPLRNIQSLFSYNPLGLSLSSLRNQCKS